MKNRINLLVVLTSGLFYGQTLTTQVRDDAGLPTTQSGFYETFNPINYPSGAKEWWHLLDVRHTNSDNNYGMQFAGSFFDQNLWFRKVNNNSNTSWSKVVLENHSGNVGIGINNPQSKLDVAGSISSSGDLISSGSNGWIFHTPDDGRTELIIAPKNTQGDWDWSKQFLFTNNGNAVFQGKIEAKEVKVTQTPTADFVFADNYGLPKLEDVEKHIKAKRHLPEIASAKEMEQEGVNIGEFQIKLLQKIEELTLYSIEQNKKLKQLEDKNSSLEKQIAAINEKLVK